MIVEAIKQSILEYAFSGKLGTNNSKESIEQYNHSQISPYQIPQNWIFSTIEDVSYTVFDGSHNPPPNSLTGVPILSAKDIYNHKVNLEDCSRYVLEEDYKTENKKINFEVGDVLLTIVGTIGRTAIIETTEKICFQRSVAVIKPKRMNSKFLMYFLESPYCMDIYKKGAKGTAQLGFYLNSLKKIIIPVPPIEEQKRIVAKIEELFIKLDYVKSIEVELKELKNNFPNDMKKSILKFAFSGEMSNEKPKMMNLEECLINIACKEYQIKQSDIKKVGKYPVVSQSKDIIEGYYDNEIKLLKHNKPVLVYGDHSNNIKYVDFDFVIGADGTKVFECKDMFDEKYLYYNILFNLNFIPRNGYSRHYKYLKELHISYFPINIQKSIVNIIEKLFLLCDDLDNIISGN